jgi:predicted naringenin-chalcone synthase
MPLSILGLGTALPVHTMSQEAALDMTTNIVGQDERQRRLLRVLFRKSAVKNRHTCVPHPIAYEWIKQEAELAAASVGGGNGGFVPSVNGSSDESFLSEQPVLNWGPTTRERMQLYAEFAAPLAKEAVGRAFEDAGFGPQDVTHLVTVSCTGFDAPGVDIELIDGLKLRPTTQRVNVGYMGCHGAINGLRVARGIAASDPKALVLLSATELCSLHYRFNWDDEGIIGNALFADGSAAIIVGNRDVHAGKPAFQLKATGSCLIPDSRHVMSWRVGDHGFEMRLTAEVSEKINTYLRPWMAEWLGEHGHSVESIASWAVHPGGPRILQSVEEALSLTRDATRVSHEVLSAYGNMSSPTVLFILDRMRRSQAPRPCVALGFGPGLVAEAALFE